MPSRPSVIVFDVNETLSDMAPMAQRFADVGVPGLLAQAWFASVLRDGFALTAAGCQGTFAAVARAALETTFARTGPDRPVAAAVEHVLSGFRDLSVHPDVPPGVRALREAGLRLITLSNGSADIAARLLAQAGLRDDFEHLLSVDDAGAWKPAAAAYAHASQVCAAPPSQLLMVAVHPWDIHGAHQAGLRTAWIARQPAPYPAVFSRPDLTAPDLPTLATQFLSPP